MTEAIASSSGPGRFALGPAAVLVLVAALLLSHPFTGIRHDGILYAGDALARLQPGQFHDDLYFLFGSQGRFTLLPAFYAALIAAFGFGGGTMVGLLLAFALYVAATLWVVTWLAPASLRVACVLAVTLGWTLYGGERVFAYSEPFLTARSFAEPVVLLAMGCMVRGRFVAAGLALLAGLVIHPLIASCGVLVLWVVLVQGDRRWLWLAVVGAAVLTLLGVLAIGPFADVFTRYDDAWLALVQEANGHAFVLRWTPNDFGIVVFDTVCLWFAWRAAERPAHRALIVAVVVVGLGATAASALLVDVGLNPFFGKLQIWRALWLMQWFAIVGLVPVGVRLWRRDAQGRVVACLLAIAWMAPYTLVPGPVGLIAVAIEVFRTRATITKVTLRIVETVTVLVACSIVFQYEARVVKLGLLLDQSARQMVAQALTMNLVVLAGAVGFFVVRRRIGRLAPVLAVVACVGAFGLWDQRPVWTRTLESQPLDRHIWSDVVEPDAKVYWYRDMIAPWILMGHANYYTQQQGSGAVFSRAMIVELEKRRRIAGMLDMQEQICRVMNNLNAKANSCEPDVAATEAICVEGGVDYVVLQSTLEGAEPVARYATGVVENGYEKRFYLYRCSALKRG